MPAQQREVILGNNLLSSLIAYWPGNEASGNLQDRHINALHLTDTNTVTSAAGKVYGLARQYTAAAIEYHTRGGDDALLSAGDVDFTLACWINMDTLAARGIAGKFMNAGQYEYVIGYSTASSRLYWRASPDGAVSTVLLANSLGLPVVGTWYLIIGWHDSVANTLNVQANGGAVDSVAYTTGVFNGNDPFQIGMGQPGYQNGRIGPTMFWKSQPGQGGVLTAQQRVALWNGGRGLRYESFDLSPAYKRWWPVDAPAASPSSSESPSLSPSSSESPSLSPSSSESPSLSPSSSESPSESPSLSPSSSESPSLSPSSSESPSLSPSSSESPSLSPSSSESPSLSPSSSESPSLSPSSSESPSLSPSSSESPSLSPSSSPSSSESPSLSPSSSESPSLSPSSSESPSLSPSSSPSPSVEPLCIVFLVGHVLIIRRLTGYVC